MEKVLNIEASEPPIRMDFDDDIVLEDDLPTSSTPLSVTQPEATMEDSSLETMREGVSCVELNSDYFDFPFPDFVRSDGQDEQKMEEEEPLKPEWDLSEFLAYLPATTVTVLEDVLRCDLEARGVAIMEPEESSAVNSMEEDEGDQAYEPTSTFFSRSFDEVQVRKDLDPQLVLKRERIKEILITTPSQGFREVLYTCDVDEDKRGDGYYEEWRHQIIPSFPNEIKQDSTSLSSKKMLRLLLPYGNANLFNVNGFQDDFHSILNVIGGEPLSWMIVDAYLTSRIILHNSRASSQSYGLRPGYNSTFHYLPCKFLPVFHKNQKPSTFLPNLEFLPKSPLRNSILIAPQVSCKHFYLAVFDFRRKRIKLFDSYWPKIPAALRTEQISQVFEHLQTKLVNEIVPDDEKKKRKARNRRDNDDDDDEDWIRWKETDWKVKEVHESLQQIDKFSCGIYVIHHAEEEMRGKYYKKKGRLRREDVGNIRMQIASELLKTTVNGKRVLEALSE